MIRFAEDPNILCPLCAPTNHSITLSDFELDLIVKGFSLCPWHDGEIESELLSLGVMSENSFQMSSSFDDEDDLEEIVLDDISVPRPIPSLRLLVS